MTDYFVDMDLALPDHLVLASALVQTDHTGYSMLVTA